MAWHSCCPHRITLVVCGAFALQQSFRSLFSSLPCHCLPSAACSFVSLLLWRLILLLCDFCASPALLALFCSFHSHHCCRSRAIVEPKPNLTYHIMPNNHLLRFYLHLTNISIFSDLPPHALQRYAAPSSPHPHCAWSACCPICFSMLHSVVSLHHRLRAVCSFVLEWCPLLSVLFICSPFFSLSVSLLSFPLHSISSTVGVRFCVCVTACLPAFCCASAAVLCWFRYSISCMIALHSSAPFDRYTVLFRAACCSLLAAHSSLLDSLHRCTILIY